MSLDLNSPEIKFPVKYNLKVIYNNSALAEEHQTKLENMLTKINIIHGKSEIGKKSETGKYVTIVIPVEISDRELFNNLYSQLKTLPDIKYAI